MRKSLYADDRAFWIKKRNIEYIMNKTQCAKVESWQINENLNNSKDTNHMLC